MPTKKGRRLTKEEKETVKQVIEEKSRVLAEFHKRYFIDYFNGRYLEKSAILYSGSAKKLYDFLKQDKRLNFLIEFVNLQDPFSRISKELMKKYEIALRDYLRRSRQEYEKASPEKRREIIGALEGKLQKHIVF